MCPSAKRKKELLSSVKTRIDFEDNVLSQISQTKEDKD